MSNEPMNMNIDAGEDGDWIKAGAWDLGAQDADQLRWWIAANEMTVQRFKHLVVYRANVGKTGMEWLRGL
jgi:hypothetical protein